MYRSTLFEYLGTFKRGEWKLFRKFLANSIGEQTDTYRLFVQIEKHASDLAHKDLNLEVVGAKSFPDSSRKTLLNYLSKLSKEIESFWIAQELKENTVASDTFKLKAFNRRGLYKKADKTGHALRKKLSSPNKLDLWDAYHLLAVNHELYFSYNPIKESKLGAEILKQCLESARAITDSFSWYYYSEVLNRQRRKHEDWGNALEKIEDQTDNKLENELRSTLEIYAHLYRNNDEDSFLLLKELLFDSNKIVSEDLSISFFIIMKRYLATKVGNGNADGNLNYIDFIYQGQLRDLAMYRGELSVEVFLGNIAALVNLGSYKKATDLIEDGEGKLPIKHRKESMAIAKMTLSLGQGDYKQVIAVHQKEQFNSLFYKVRAIPLVLRATFESSDDSSSFLEYQIRNYKDYLKRQQAVISSRQLSGQFNFLTVLGMMTKNKSKTEIEGVMENMGFVFYRSWVIKIIEGRR